MLLGSVENAGEELLHDIVRVGLGQRADVEEQGLGTGPAAFPEDEKVVLAHGEGGHCPAAAHRVGGELAAIEASSGG